MNKKSETKTLSVMFLDIVSYTTTTSNLTRDEIDSLHEIFDKLSLPLFDQFGGNVVKKIGDAYLATFDSPTNAVLCGIYLQKEFHNFRLENVYKNKIHIRVAIDMGEVVIRDSDIYGDAVNMAARIEGIAKAGHVMFSETIFNSMNKNEIPIVPVRPQILKGFKKPVPLFRVKTKADEALQKQRKRKKTVKKIKNSTYSLLRNFFTMTLAILLLIILAFLIYIFTAQNNIFF